MLYKTRFNSNRNKSNQACYNNQMKKRSRATNLIQLFLC